jgi:hypothetical protein
MPGVVFPPPAPPAAVRQPAFVGTAGTPGCDGATTWRIGLRIFRADDAGGTVSADKRAAVLGWQQQWADRVGTYGQCAVRVVVDVYDMEDAVAKAGEYQPDATGLREKGDYEVLFDLVPEVPNPGWVEKTNGTHAVFLDVAGEPEPARPGRAPPRLAAQRRDLVRPGRHPAEGHPRLQRPRVRDDAQPDGGLLRGLPARQGREGRVARHLRRDAAGLLGRVRDAAASEAQRHLADRPPLP